jgi:ribosomal protein L11 methyltransferase
MPETMTHSMSDWLSVEIDLDTANEHVADVFTAALFEGGVAGLEIRDGGESITVIASFAPEIEAGTIPGIIDKALSVANLTASKITTNAIEPIDWSTHWRKHFHPLGFGRFWVVPSWLEAPAEAEQVLVVDPSMAFGTGRHETTRLCLKRIIDGDVPASVLDVGTGTAILVMAAMMNGATRVMGTDNDPDALIVARENADRNGLSEGLRLSDKDPDKLNEQFELVIANILRDPLIALAPRIAKATSEGGRVVLSGILESQVSDVRKAYEESGFIYVEHGIEGEWACLEMSKT